MRICLEFLTESVKPENQQAVGDAVSTLLRLARTDAAADSGPTPVAVDPPKVKDDPPQKQKRKRRTQAEIKADKAAKEAEKAEPKEDETVTADLVVPDEATAISEADVKAAVVACVKRLTDEGHKKPRGPTVLVVERLIELTGKKKVQEIEPADYGRVTLALSEEFPLPEEDDAEDLF